MRHLAIGDIHGCLRALQTLAETVPFKTDDVLITLGDHVDRGPDSCAVIDWLIATAQRQQVISLRGNHEVMMLEARGSYSNLKIWLECGGDTALKSYAPVGGVSHLVHVPDAHWDFLKQTRPYFETATHFFVHANALPDYPLREQPDAILYWEFFNNPPPHQSGKIMVCGHTPQKAGHPLSLGHAICLDTNACRNGWLTCLDVDSGQYWQANQRGETRSDWLLVRRKRRS